jgi:Holliday junction resolvase RusA-like endonuclease
MPCPRPRVTRGGIAYMPAVYKKWKADFIRCIPYTCKQGLTGPVSVFIDARWSVPKSYSKNERAEALCGRKYPAADNDNIAKGVLDAMTQGGVWVDDKQVVRLEAVKRYADDDGITVRVVSR